MQVFSADKLPTLRAHVVQINITVEHVQTKSSYPEHEQITRQCTRFSTTQIDRDMFCVTKATQASPAFYDYHLRSHDAQILIHRHTFYYIYYFLNLTHALTSKIRHHGIILEYYSILKNVIDAFSLFKVSAMRLPYTLKPIFSIS